MTSCTVLPDGFRVFLRAIVCNHFLNCSPLFPIAHVCSEREIRSLIFCLFKKIKSHSKCSCSHLPHRACRFPLLREHRPLILVSASAADTQAAVDQRHGDDVQAETVHTDSQARSRITSSSTNPSIHLSLGEEGYAANQSMDSEIKQQMLQRSAPPPRYYRRLARLSSVNQNHGRPRTQLAQPVELRQLQVLADQTLGWASPVWDIKEAVEVRPSPDLEYSDSVSSSSLKTIIELIEDDPNFLAERVNLLASRGDFYSAITLMVTAKMHDRKMPAFTK